ncbi:DUF1007 family protein [Pelagibacterium limicola]|uniref:HoxN/HupN/NixA family nickel/cobalt transporter n=1 Tax=Pelagibacterium limicola TaxID=2791022 RepID=UPI0018B007E3|nr:DUF1007 family protein [Pelagibacterium limicola]
MIRIFLVILLSLFALPAVAHPHVWIDARGEVIFEDGALTAMRHSWMFDPYFSAWAIQGLDADGDGVLTPEELQPLAEENIVGLDFYNYYTFAGSWDDPLAIARADNPSMAFDGDRLTLNFTVRFAQPRPIGRTIDIEVGDPEYYAAFTFPGADAVTLRAAPADCYAEAHGPEPVDPAIEEELWLLGPEVTELPEELREAARSLANLVVITCPLQQAETALDAIGEATTPARPRTPFAAPPAEPVIAPGQGGLLGWIGEQQRSFYQAMTGALSALHEDGNAFWILGGLSFLYGVFHAAGPGHGKVVISSYVLANERQLRRGVLLSFLASMMQAAVAIGFVLIAALALRLTAIAMSDAAHWMAVGSYGLIALLGAWLAARHLLGLGHRHHHGRDDHHHEHHHHHDHTHGHGEGCEHHVVKPSQTGGDWRAALGVIVSVGMRPCSGALVVLAFSLSQGLLAAGIVATLMMSVGTALTVASLASLAVGAKGLALRLAGGGSAGASALWWLELAGALLIMGFGLMLLFASL